MASIYDKASLVMIPSGSKEGKLYSQKPTNGDGDFTFSRSTAATRVNASGNIEKETQNLLLHSNSFDTTWIKSSTSVTSGHSGYDGSSDAWKLIQNTTNTFHFIYQNVSVSSICTLSIYAKAGEYSGISFFFPNLAGASTATTFNLSTGAFVNNTHNATAEDVGNGWYRIKLLSNTTSVSSQNFNIYVNQTTQQSEAGDGTSGIYIQDAQLEQGLVARDYIETTTTAIYGGITDNVPRLDYTDSSCPALLLEPQRTNLVTQSELGTALDVQGGGITNNETTSPEGFNNAYKFLETTYAGNHGTYNQLTGQGTGTDYAVSVFVKKLGRRYVGLQSWYGSTDGAIIYVDLDNGTIEDTYAEGTGYSVSNANIDDYGNGWYRISGVFQSGNSNQYYGLVSMDELWTSGTSYDNVFAGDVTKGFYSYGLQVEQGSYATSYIPTYGSAVTRNEDAMNVAGATDIIGQTEGTIFVEVDAVDFSTDQRIGIGDGTAANRIVIRFASGSVIQLSAVIGSTTQASISGSGSVGNTYKVAGVYKENDFALWINGIEVATDTSGTISGTFSRIANDNGFSTQKFANPIKQFLLFPTRLSNEELATLTTI